MAARRKIIIPGQRWQDFGITMVTEGRDRGWVLTPIKRQARSAAALMEAQVPIELAWCRTHVAGGRPSTRFLAYRVCGALGLSHEKVDQAEDIIVYLRRLPVAKGGIGMFAVRDARSSHNEPWTPEPADAAQGMFDQLGDLRAHRQEGQPFRAVFLCEADGSMPFFEDVCDEYGVPLYSGSGSVPLSLVAKLKTEARLHFNETNVATVFLCLTDLDLMGLKNIFMPFARDIERFAAQERVPEAMFVRRLGVTPNQVLDHLPASVRQAGVPTMGKPPRPVTWWPVDRNGDAWILPTAEALLDVLPGILRDALDTLLPNKRKRKAMTNTEPTLRQDTADVLRGLL